MLPIEGITDPRLLQACQSVLHTIARCPPGLYGKLHKYSCLLYPPHALVAYGVMGASAAVMLAFTAPILVLHTLSYNIWLSPSVEE